ncbi:bZIP transcription factor [Beauveria brongniartii RCEF 3172]|uniref:BZIP transcription factor n=1 Tax=Beauveria brongniartii RCEF 3172 TaxID=1081107 RepID=A0A167L9L1_9HYPO|nr:bZIP transcription factor [Beauveria brongniartii RCEF 3172]
MDTKPSKVKRTLTEKQLDKKRSIDKIKHRENRAENKARLESIERDVSFLRHNIGDLVLQLRQLNVAQAPPQHRLSPASSHGGPSTSSQNHLHGLSNPFLSLAKPEPWNSPPDSAPAPVDAATAAAAFYTSAADHSITERLYAQHTFPQRPLEAQMDMEALLAEVRDQGLLVECRCGKPHSADVQCTEPIASIMAVEFSSVSGHNSQRIMTAPRDPTLPEMLLHHTDMSNPLAAIVSSILRQYDITHIDSLCGVFLLAYRLLRASISISCTCAGQPLLTCVQWRYYPSADSMADVPAIMRPTPVQITIRHPKSLDFIPFPALRNYLCLNQNKDARHSVDLYLRSLRLVLPPGQSLLAKTERGCVELNPEFEMTASDVRNWNMGPPWSEYFPQLRQFLY